MYAGMEKKLVIIGLHICAPPPPTHTHTFASDVDYLMAAAVILPQVPLFLAFRFPRQL